MKKEEQEQLNNLIKALRMIRSICRDNSRTKLSKILDIHEETGRALEITGERILISDIRSGLK